MTLTARQAVPRWYSFTSLHNPPGLELVIHLDTWHRALSRCENEIDLKTFRVTAKEHDWVSVKFPFPAGDIDVCRSLQRTLAVLFQEIDCTEKVTHPTQHQLMACGILRSVNELRGYLLDTYVSYKMKCLLKKNPIEAAKIATDALRSAVRRFHLPTEPKDFSAFVENNGFLYLGVGDGSGSFLGANFRDREKPDAIHGYTMTSDNIDNPTLQLILLYGFAAVAAWGEKQYDQKTSPCPEGRPLSKIHK